MTRPTTRPTLESAQKPKFARVLTRHDFQPLRPPAALPTPSSGRNRRLASRFEEFSDHVHRTGASNLAQACALARDGFIRLEAIERQVDAAKRQIADLQAELGDPPEALVASSSSADGRSLGLADFFSGLLDRACWLCDPYLVRVCALARDGFLHLDVAERELDAARRRITYLQAELVDQFTAPTRTVRVPLVDHEKPTAVQFIVSDEDV